MKPEIKFDDWAKLEMQVGEIIIDKSKKKIRIGEKLFDFNFNLALNSGDKIVVGLTKEGIILPVIDEKVLLSPESDIENGSKVS